MVEAIPEIEPVDLESLKESAPEADDPKELAEWAGLHYGSDDEPGYRRIRCGFGFRYVDWLHHKIVDQKNIDRIRELAIPPAWTHVWISCHPNGHIQATGRDQKGRKQYIYHPLWRQVRDETKYHRMISFGANLPEIRRHVQRDLSRTGAVRERVLATIVHLLDTTALRIGNVAYARENESFGLTTLRSDHVDLQGSTLRFQFRAKGGKDLSLSVKDRRIANVIGRLQELPGQELFRYFDGAGELHDAGSHDVNQYLHDITGQHFTAKDFRTWVASVATAEALVAIGEYSSATGLKRNANLAISEAARRLGNTKTVCRNSYVHPHVITAYEQRWLMPTWKAGYTSADPEQSLKPEEVALLAVLTHAANIYASELAKAV